jgi:acetyl esterase/lipase
MLRSLIIVALLAVSVVGAEDLFEGAPAVPEGFESQNAARMALMSGKIPIVEMEPDAPDTLTVTKDIVYASPEGMDVKLDLFVPKDADAPPPVLLFIHGGGWTGGNKDDYAYYNIKFAELGYATASTQYRLAQEAKFPAAIQDVNCALAWLRENGAEHGFDGSRVAVIGGSAGGHLSLLAGYSQAETLNCPGDSAGTKGQIKAIVNLYGVTDCTTPTAIAAHQVKNFIGGSYEDKQGLYELASPILHLDAEDPPTLTFHGTVDETVPVRQADLLHDKLGELEIPNYYDRIEGWPHTMDLAKPINERCRYVTERFLAKYLPVKE